MADINDVDSYDLLRFAESYSKLGWSVQAQLQTLMAEGSRAELNGNAVTMIIRELRPLPDDIKSACEDWLRDDGREASSRTAGQRVGPHIRFDGRLWVHPSGPMTPRPGGWDRVNLSDKRGNPLKTEVEVYWGQKPGELSYSINRGRTLSTTYEDLGLVVTPVTEEDVIKALGDSQRKLVTKLAFDTADTLISEGFGAAEARGFSAALAEDVNFYSLARVLGDARGPDTKAKYSDIAMDLGWGIFEAAYFGVVLAKRFHDQGTVREIMSHWVEEYTKMQREDAEQKFHMRGASATRVADAYEKEAWGGRGLPTMPRDSFVPTHLRGTEKLVDSQGTDVAVWTWEDESPRDGRTRYVSVAFTGKSNKPVWYESYRSDAERQKRIDGLIAWTKKRDADKVERLQQRRDFRHDIKVGDIYSTSWGYDQTNVDWYEVTDASEKSIVVREIGSEVDHSERGADYVVPVPGKFVGKPMRVIPGPGGLSIEGHGASKWSGKPQYETALGWGH